MNKRLIRNIDDHRKNLVDSLKNAFNKSHIGIRSHIHILLITIIAGIAALSPSPVSAANSGLTIDISDTYQNIDGMGVNINVNSWEEGLVKPAIDALVETNGSSIFRVVRDPTDWVNSESLIPALHNLDTATLQQVYEASELQDLWNTLSYLNQKGIRGEQIVLSFQGWLPRWVGGSGEFNESSYITPGKEPQFATMLASLVYYATRVKNLDFTSLAPLNEPDLEAGI